MKLKGGFMLYSPVGVSIQETTQLIRPDGKDENRCADTAQQKLELWKWWCCILPHNTRPSRLDPRHLVPVTVTLTRCQHPMQAKSHGAGMGAMVPGMGSHSGLIMQGEAQSPGGGWWCSASQFWALGWSHKENACATSCGRCLRVWLGFSGEALTFAGKYAS